MEHKYKQYCNYAKRNTTFRSIWPEHLPIDPVSLIVEGFFYTGKSDWVICYSCGVGFRNLSRFDDLFDIHYAASPQCQKLKSSPDFTLNVQVHNPSVDVRKKSFTPETRDLAFLNEAPDTSTFGYLQSKMKSFKIKYKSKLIDSSELIAQLRNKLQATTKILMDVKSELTSIKTKLLNYERAIECPECMEIAEVRLNCGHLFCENCAEGLSHCYLCNIAVYKYDKVWLSLK